MWLWWIVASLQWEAKGTRNQIYSKAMSVWSLAAVEFKSHSTHPLASHNMIIGGVNPFGVHTHFIAQRGPKSIVGKHSLVRRLLPACVVYIVCEIGWGGVCVWTHSQLGFCLPFVREIYVLFVLWCYSCLSHTHTHHTAWVCKVKSGRVRGCRGDPAQVPSREL